jgi:tetratricopeptide (TPR) repeat protein
MKLILSSLIPSLMAVGAAAAAPASIEEQLWHHRNLGKAFYENNTTQYQAVEEFKKALDLAPSSIRERLNYGLSLLRAGKIAEGVVELEKVQQLDPTLPHTWFNLGIAAKRDSNYKRAIAQFEKMVELVPDEPISRFNLGVLYKSEGRNEQALAQFEEAARLDPNLAGPHFQLTSAYKQLGRTEDAARELALFQEIKKRNAGAAVPEDLEWSWYGEIWDPIDAKPVLAVPAGPPKLVARELAAGFAGAEKNAPAGLIVLDADGAVGVGDGGADLLAWSAAGVRLFRNGVTAVDSGLEKTAGLRAVAAGDFDNDGLVDLCLVGETVRLAKNAKGRFTELPVALPAGRFATAVWLDYDHDYDLDLVLLGDGAALVRNNGDGTWSDETARFPFRSPGKGGTVTAAVAFDVVADSQGIDLAVAYADGPGILYRDRLAGRYEVEELPGLAAGTVALAAEDVDQDSWTDLVAAGPEGVAVLVNRRTERGVTGTWERRPVAGAAGGFALADLWNRGTADLIAGQVFRGEGRGAFAAGVEAGLDRPRALAAADFDGDGRVDLAALGSDGVLRLLTNQSAGAGGFLRFALLGVKNPVLAPGAEVEIKAGTLYQKKIYRGVPLHVGLGAEAAADTVRITWPNGLIQNESKQATTPVATVAQAAGAAALKTYKEAQRLSGSCPMVFTWDGKEFRFITDVLGVAPLGASAGDGVYFPVDHDEVVQIPGEALVARDGRYEIRLTEELREVAYFDQVRLSVVDHPAAVEIFTNDKFKAPPFPEFRLFGVTRRIAPVKAVDHRGRDVRERLLHKDRTYPDGFRRGYDGIAELHHLDLDFGPVARDGKAVLVLSGWLDWADGSTFLGAAQARGGGLILPSLQVKDAAGQWRTVIEDMGIPAGKPKTIVVDLSGKWLSPAREVRIVTNLCLYWDEVFLSEETGAPPVRRTILAPDVAELRYRGFSTPIIHPERKQPEAFDYQRPMPLSMWNPTPGLYTRFGEVRPLLTQVDDHLVIMGSGDELRLLFDATALPTLPAGWTRDFLLEVDGWAKDGDANTAYSQSVEPLPFHGMSQYPYSPAERAERFPDSPEHRLTREFYQTRPALRLLRPLSPEASAQRSER